MFQAPYLIPWMIQQAKFPSYYIQSPYFLKPTENTFKENPTTNSTYIPYPATNTTRIPPHKGKFKTEALDLTFILHLTYV